MTTKLQTWTNQLKLGPFFPPTNRYWGWSCCSCMSLVGNASEIICSASLGPGTNQRHQDSLIVGVFNMAWPNPLNSNECLITISHPTANFRTLQLSSAGRPYKGRSLLRRKWIITDCMKSCLLRKTGLPCQQGDNKENKTSKFKQPSCKTQLCVS